MPLVLKAQLDLLDPLANKVRLVPRVPQDIPDQLDLLAPQEQSKDTNQIASMDLKRK